MSFVSHSCCYSSFLPCYSIIYIWFVIYILFVSPLCSFHRFYYCTWIYYVFMQFSPPYLVCMPCLCLTNHSCCCSSFLNCHPPTLRRHTHTHTYSQASHDLNTSQWYMMEFHMHSKPNTLHMFPTPKYTVIYIIYTVACTIHGETWAHLCCINRPSNLCLRLAQSITCPLARVNMSWYRHNEVSKTPKSEEYKLLYPLVH